MLGALVFGTLGWALGQTALLPALTRIASALKTTPSGAAWTVTTSLLSAALLTPVVGRLGDMFGRRRTLVLSLTVVALGGVISAVATSLALVVVGRVLFGVGGGLFPLSFGLIRDLYPPSKRASYVGLIAAVAGLGGGLGAAFGGVFVDYLSFRWIFWAGAAMAASAAALAPVVIPRTPRGPSCRVDWVGVIVLAGAVTAPLLAMSQAKWWGWADPRVVALLVIGVVLGLCFAVVERRTVAPLIDFAVLRRPTVAITNVAALLSGFGLYSAFLLISQLAEAPRRTGYGLGWSAAQSGLLLLPGCVCMVLTGSLCGALSRRVGTRRVLQAGSSIAAVGLLALAAEPKTSSAVLLESAVLFAGVGLAFAAMSNLIVDAVSPAQTGEATGVNSLLRIMGSAIGAQVTVTILAATTQGAGAPTGAGYEAAFLLAAAITALASFVSILLPSNDITTGADTIGNAIA